jgi:hypothetical protein
MIMSQLAQLSLQSENIKTRGCKDSDENLVHYDMTYIFFFVTKLNPTSSGINSTTDAMVTPP